MIVSMIVNTASWVSSIEQPINGFISSHAEFISDHIPLLKVGVNWLAILSGLVFLIIVIWTIADLTKRITEAEEIKPNLVFDTTGEWQFYSQPPGNAIYRAAQIWFVNKPKTSTTQSEAKQITASMTFYNRKTKQKFEVFGCFTEAEVPDHATIRNVTEVVDVWPPNAIPRKLVVAFRYPGDEAAYGFARSNFLHVGDGRDQARRISPGKHYVEVVFAGAGIGQPSSWFALTNPLGDTPISISRIKKPNLRKEGFLTE